MNKAGILLSTVSIALLVTLVMRSQRANAILESAQKETLSVSNQLNEAQIKLNHQERMNAALQGQLAGRDQSAAGLSNSLGQVRVTLATTRAELEAARAEIPPALARGNAFAAERDGFSNRVQEVASALGEQEQQLRIARERAVTAQAALAALSQQLAAAQIEQLKLENQLADPALLQARLAASRRRPSGNAPAKTTGQPDFHQPLQLQPDGTVLLASPAPASGN